MPIDTPPSNESPVINMPESQRGKVESKLHEYEARLTRIKAERNMMPFDAFKAPEFFKEFNEDTCGTIYKIAVAKELLEKGTVNTHDLSRKLEAEHGVLYASRFNNACAVMLSYCEGRR